ncbi:hypothetical protein ACPPVQ_04540 [Diaminobutyricibacter sp. McL0618]|uniref:hypothetical protein n=1 Tax=Leifsonia sp. McL0618 TaxID=3415677 RepID=UPI003CF0C2FF
MNINNPMIQLRTEHLEWYRLTKSAGPIAVTCDCAIGQDHEYADWLALTFDERLPPGDLSTA